MKKEKNRRGYFIVQTLVFAGVAILVIGALTSFVGSNLKAARQIILREQAIQIAEAGIDYYRWHLAHAPKDFKDGTNISGPYIHNFYNKNGDIVGTFSLEIIAPLTGSTLVTIKSTGSPSVNPSVKRTIQVKMAIPSFAKYAVVANDDMRFGPGTVIFGPVFSNNGIRFDGLAHNIVASARASYDDPDHSGDVEFGVHTHVNAPPSTGVNDTFRSVEAPPSTVPSRTDVFIAGRQVSAPAVDFTGITANLAQIKTDAQANGRYFGSSGALGYKIVLKTNNTFDIYKVNTLINPPNNCTNTGNQTGWGTWSVNGTTFLQNYVNPTNGLIFAEDHVWVEGQINIARITIASAKFPDNPTTRTSITVNNNLLYTNYDGRDIISLIAQGNINTGMASLSTLRIDAALMAQNGRAGRYYYGSNCSPYNNRTSLTLYGMIGSANRYGFAYTDGTGYATRQIIYDANLLYSPPPSFPLTSDKYQTISWEEI